MKNHSQTRPSTSGFTLIEMLIVIAIIAILAGLLVPAVAMMNQKKTLARARAQIAELSTAIDRYQQKKGFYPPDQPGKPSTNQLLYELWGAMPNGTTEFTNDFGQGTRITVAKLSSIFGATAIINASPEVKEVDNFIANFKLEKVKDINNDPTAPVWVLFFPSKGPNDVTFPNGITFNTINYVASNPKHNANTYDLWIDVVLGGKTNRVSNWSSEAEKKVGPY